MRSNKDRTWGILVILAVALAMASCGPMNGQKKSGDATAGDSASNPAAATGATRLSTESRFYVYAALSSATGAATPATPALGDNTYVVRIAHSSDLHPLSNDAVVRLTYEMPDMPAMGTSEATVARQPDGSFSATLFYSMSGRWRVTVKLQDAGSQDEYVFETTP